MNAIEFYDKDFNLISSEDFGGFVYIYDMGYYDGKYYCTYKEDYEGIEDTETGEIRYEPIRDTLQHRNEISRWITKVSEDRIHWIETDEEIPRNNDRVTMAAVSYTHLDVYKRQVTTPRYKMNRSLRFTIIPAI